MSNNKQIVHIVPHSHWDREWYFTIEDSQVLFCENLLYLMTVLEQDKEFKAYVFDGQVSILDDFLKYHPEEKERLSKLIKDKRIFVGPWYTQTDSLLVHKETIIRNLYYGIKIAKSLGHSMDIGYLPDIFGQNAYLPSIFKNFGVTASIFQRGISNSDLSNGLNVNWQSPDGVSIFANNIFLGYGPGKFLASDDNYINKTLLPMLDKLSYFNKNQKNLLLPAGGDQVLVRSHYPNTVKEINKKLENYELVMSSYEDFINASKLEGEPKKTAFGELRVTQKSRIHRTIGSQRYDIKQLNSTFEHKAINLLEPLNAMSMINTEIKTVPQTWFDDIWKTSFDSHSHDSIGGCNSDDTNKNIVARLQRVTRITDDYTNIIQKRFAHSIRKNDENILIVWNTDLHRFNGWVQATIFDNKDFTVKDKDNKDIKIQIVRKTYISGGKKIVVTAEKEVEVEVEGYYQYDVLMNVELMPFSYTTFNIVHTDNFNEVSLLEKSISNDSFIECASFKLSFNNGEFEWLNKATNNVYKNPFKFELTEDAGDSYDYSPIDEHNLNELYLQNAKLISCKKTEYVQELKVEHTIDIKDGQYQNEAHKMIITTTFELRENELTLRVHHVIDNKTKNCRVRALWSVLKNGVKSSFSDQAFSFIEHSVIDKDYADWREKKFAEAPVAIYNMESIAYLKDDNKNLLACFTLGLKEYEVLDSKIDKSSTTLALTLFRSVGLLGRDNLAWRPGRASGINNKEVLTPDAFMLKKLEFSYGICFSHDLDEVSLPAKLFKLYNDYASRVTTYHYQTLNSFYHRLDRFELHTPKVELEKDATMLSLTNEDVMTSSVRAIADGKNRNVFVRLFNPTSKVQETALKVNAKNYKAFETNLLEEDEHSVNLDCIILKPKSYTTIKIKL